MYVHLNTCDFIILSYLIIILSLKLSIISLQIDHFFIVQSNFSRTFNKKILMQFLAFRWMTLWFCNCIDINFVSCLNLNSIFWKTEMYSFIRFVEFVPNFLFSFEFFSVIRSGNSFPPNSWTSLDMDRTLNFDKILTVSA